MYTIYKIITLYIYSLIYLIYKLTCPPNNQTWKQTNEHLHQTGENLFGDPLHGVLHLRSEETRFHIDLPIAEECEEATAFPYHQAGLHVFQQTQEKDKIRLEVSEVDGMQ